MTGTGFVHEAVLYADDEAYVDELVPFVTDGVEAGEPTMVAVPSWRLEQLLPHLPVESPLLKTVAMEEIGRNPRRIIPAWNDFVEQAQVPGKSLRGIGEPAWFGRNEAEFVECATHEGLLNMAFANASSFHLLCPYDVGRLEPVVVDRARRTHPLIRQVRVVEKSDYYDVSAGLDPGSPLVPPPADAIVLEFDGGTLRGARHLVQQVAIEAGMSAGRVDDLAVALSEALCNSVRHAGGRGELRVWNDGREIVCEVRDAGEIADALAGRVRPTSHRQDGRGLWIMNQLSDLVQLCRADGVQSLRLVFSLRG